MSGFRKDLAQRSPRFRSTLWLLAVGLMVILAACGQQSQPQVATVLVSEQQDMSDARSIEGQTLSGDVFLSIAEEDEVEEAAFYLGDPESGDAVLLADTEEFQQSALRGRGHSFNTRTLPNGRHLLTVIIKIFGGEHRLSYWFDVFNPDNADDVEEPGDNDSGRGDDDDGRNDGGGQDDGGRDDGGQDYGGRNDDGGQDDGGRGDDDGSRDDDGGHDGGDDGDQGQPGSDRPSPAPNDVIWFADHEDGSLGQWSSGSCGGQFNSGGGRSSVTDRVSRTGDYAAQATIANVNGDQGVRLFRWCESQRNDELYYSTWYYIPQQFNTVAGWWNIFQFKSKTPNTNDPFFILNVGNRSNGGMHFYLYDWQRERSYTQNAMDIPVGRWFHVEVYYKSAGDNSGAITVWQDGVEIFDVQNVQTRYPNGDTQWALTNYTSRISPDPATIYLDDAAISRSRLGPEVYAFR